MQLPSWLAGLTGADKFANNPANGFRATFGDMAQAAGHSIMQHYRGQGGKYGGPTLTPGVNANPSLASVLSGLGPKTPAPQREAITGGELPTVSNPSPMAAQPEPVSNPAQAQAITSLLNGGNPWGRLPLNAIMMSGLRPF